MAASFILMHRSLSPAVKKRFPTLSSVTDTGKSTSMGYVSGPVNVNRQLAAMLFV
jgi:hypothetical protein